jgi:hypothetical protein
MDILAFISDQTIHLLSVALPDANPKQIRLLLLSCVGLAIVLMMFAIMWSMFREKRELQENLSPKAETPTKPAEQTKAKKGGKTSKPAVKLPAKQATKADKAVSKKAAMKKASAKKKTESKIRSPIDPEVDAGDDILRTDDAKNTKAPASDDTASGFSFFKRESSGTKVDAELISIEQEMLAIRQLYMDERITKDVYVVETRRLYEKASELRSV